MTGRKDNQNELHLIFIIAVNQDKSTGKCMQLSTLNSLIGPVTQVNGNSTFSSKFFNDSG